MSVLAMRLLPYMRGMEAGHCLEQGRCCHGRIGIGLAPMTDVAGGPGQSRAGCPTSRTLSPYL